MKIKACIGKEFAKQLMAIGGQNELIAFIVGRTTDAIEHTCNLPPLDVAVNLVGVVDCKEPDGDSVIRVESDVYPEYSVYYCEHHELHHIDPGFNGLREAVDGGNAFVKDLITSIDQWLIDNDIDRYKVLNMAGYVPNQSAIAVVAKGSKADVH